jgi:hypothetical protein
MASVTAGHCKVGSKRVGQQRQWVKHYAAASASRNVCGHHHEHAYLVPKGAATPGTQSRRSHRSSCRGPGRRFRLRWRCALHHRSKTHRRCRLASFWAPSRLCQSTARRLLGPNPVTFFYPCPSLCPESLLRGRCGFTRPCCFLISKYSTVRFLAVTS